MKNTTHRVVILKNVKSELISQAILILKDTSLAADTNVMAEAERIVEKYMGTKTGERIRGKKEARIAAGILSAGIVLIGMGALIISKMV